jgi:hypothetical protein
MGQSFQDKKVPFDVDALLHPSNAFRHPLDIVRDPDMTAAEKRAVLASWASDACASNPTPRCGQRQLAMLSATMTSPMRYSHWTSSGRRRRWPTPSGTASGAGGGPSGKGAAASQTTVTSAQTPLDSGSNGGKGFQQALRRHANFETTSVRRAILRHFVDRRHHLARRCLMDHVAVVSDAAKRALRHVGM